MGTLYCVSSIVIFLSSLQMLMLFILGEYLSRDYLENKNRPIYIVREQDSKPAASNVYDITPIRRNAI